MPNFNEIYTCSSLALFFYKIFGTRVALDLDEEEYWEIITYVFRGKAYFSEIKPTEKPLP